MRVTVKFFAILRDRAGTSELALDLPAGATVGRAGELIGERLPALRDFLPREIITKTKHGFGLPAGLWLRDVPRLRALAADALIDLKRTRIFNDALLDDLMRERIAAHPAYYGTLVWVLLMLAAWLNARRLVV